MDFQPIFAVKFIYVIREENVRADQKSFMWVFCGGPTEKRSVIFEYSETRESEVPKRFFEDYSGYLMYDGYSAYKYIDSEDCDIKRLCCWAHGRRNFTDAIKIAGKNAEPGIAHKAVKMIAKLYAVEKEAREKNIATLLSIIESVKAKNVII